MRVGTKATAYSTGYGDGEGGTYSCYLAEGIAKK